MQVVNNRVIAAGLKLKINLVAHGKGIGSS
jgi:hypothetical protein